MESDLKTRQYLVAFLAPICLFSFVLLSLSWYFEFPVDDLSRIGFWAQKDFGEHSQQPVIYRRGNGKGIVDPAILVLGDSFSQANSWQSFLPDDTQFRTLTFHYKNVVCPKNWIRWNVQQAFPTVKTVIIQVVERDFVERFRQVECADEVPKAVEISSDVVAGHDASFALIKDVGFLLRVAKNSWEMNQVHGRIASKDVANVPLNTRKLFSNQKPDRLLYFRNDERKRNWNKTAISSSIANLKLLQDTVLQRGWKFLMVVVPDKSTVYKQFMRDAEDRIDYPDIFADMDAAGINQVRLLPYFEQQASLVTDLYSPGDTHLSHQGYQLLAKKIQEKL